MRKRVCGVKVLFYGYLGWVGVLLLSAQTVFAQTVSDVNFTLGLNTGVDSGLNYTNSYSGDAGPSDRYVIGFEIDLNSVDGVSLALDPVAAFCSEIAEPISVSVHTFDAEPLHMLAAGTAGQVGTASAGIPVNGIGELRAARVQYFFDQNYTSVNLAGWVQQDLHAFQLGLWELTHDADMDLFNTSGFHYYGAQTGSTADFRDESLALAQTWLDAVNAADISNTYQSTQFEFWALTDLGQQDVILAHFKGSPEEEVLTELIVVPEPVMLGVLLPVFVVILGMRRR